MDDILNESSFNVCLFFKYIECSIPPLLFLLSHLYTCLQLSAAVCQDAQRQVQGFPGVIWAFEQVQQGPETTLSSESGNASLVTLDVLRPDSNQGSPLRNSGPLVHFSATA